MKFVKSNDIAGYYETSAMEKPEELPVLFEDAMRIALGKEPVQKLDENQVDGPTQIGPLDRMKKIFVSRDPDGTLRWCPCMTF